MIIVFTLKHTLEQIRYNYHIEYLKTYKHISYICYETLNESFFWTKKINNADYKNQYLDAIYIYTNFFSCKNAFFLFEDNNMKKKT